VKAGFPPKAIEQTEEILKKKLTEVFTMRENCILIIDKDKIKSEEEEIKEEEFEGDKFAEDEVVELSNTGCAPEDATKMFKEEIQKDKDYLIKSLKLAIEGSIENPEEMRDTICSIMLSMPETYNKEFIGMDPSAYVEWL